MKKGNIHIDWVVSIAIFLSFIIILLSFLRPNYNPSFEGDVLIDMIINNFNEQTEWSVRKTLFNFECTSGVVKFKVDNYIEDVVNLKIYKYSSGELMQSFNGYNYNQDNKELSIQLSSGNEKFWMIDNSLENYPNGDLLVTETVPCDEIRTANPTIFKGINSNKLSEIKSSGFVVDKFPELRSYKVALLRNDGQKWLDTNGNDYCLAKNLDNNGCWNLNIMGDVQVYSANIGTVILDKDLNKEQVIINVQAW